MPLVFKQFKVYVRLALLVALALVIVLVVFYNRTNKVNVWFFKSYESINVLWLLVCTAIASIVSWWIVSASFGLWRDLRDLGRAAELKKTQAEQEKLVANLAETEKRIDKKLKDAISQKEET